MTPEKCIEILEKEANAIKCHPYNPEDEHRRNKKQALLYAISVIKKAVDEVGMEKVICGFVATGFCEWSIKDEVEWIEIGEKDAQKIAIALKRYLTNE